MALLHCSPEAQQSEATALVNTIFYLGAQGKQKKQPCVGVCCKAWLPFLKQWVASSQRGGFFATCDKEVHLFSVLLYFSE